MVGRFIQKQQIGTTNQGLGKVEAHTPAAGKRFDGMGMFFLRETQAVKQFGGACRSGIGIDFFKFGVIFGLLHAVVLRFCLGQGRLKSLQFGIALQNVV